MIKFANKKDIIIILVLVLLALIFLTLYGLLGIGGKGAYAEILYNGKQVMRVNLDRDTVFSIDGLPNVVFEVKDDTIAFIKSDCPDKICVNTGKINSGVAACLPNNVIVRIEVDDAVIDAVAN